MNDNNLVTESWDDKEDYSYLMDKEMSQFAWEFLRRNIDYQTAYGKYSSYPSDEGLKDIQNKQDKDFFYRYFDSKPPCQKHESYEKWVERLEKEKCRRWFSSKLASFIESYDLTPGLDIDKYNHKNKDSPGFVSLDEYPKIQNYSNNKRLPYMIASNPDEIVAIINVNLPLDEQFSAIKEAAKQQRKRLSEEQPDIKAYKKNNELYIKYIRLLDADAQGANEAEILYYLYPELCILDSGESINSIEQLDSLLKNPLKYGSLDNVSLKRTLNEHRKAAKILRDRDYVSLVKSVSHYERQIPKIST